MFVSSIHFSGCCWWLLLITAVVQLWVVVQGRNTPCSHILRKLLTSCIWQATCAIAFENDFILVMLHHLTPPMLIKEHIAAVNSSSICLLPPRTLPITLTCITPHNSDRRWTDSTTTKLIWTRFISQSLLSRISLVSSAYIIWEVACGLSLLKNRNTTSVLGICILLAGWSLKSIDLFIFNLSYKPLLLSFSVSRRPARISLYTPQESCLLATNQYHRLLVARQQDSA